MPPRKVAPPAKRSAPGKPQAKQQPKKPAGAKRPAGGDASASDAPAKRPKHAGVKRSERYSKTPAVPEQELDPEVLAEGIAALDEYAGSSLSFLENLDFDKKVEQGKMIRPERRKMDNVVPDDAAVFSDLTMSELSDFDLDAMPSDDDIDLSDVGDGHDDDDGEAGASASVEAPVISDATLISGFGDLAEGSGGDDDDDDAGSDDDMDDDMDDDTDDDDDDSRAVHRPRSWESRPQAAQAGRLPVKAADGSIMVPTEKLEVVAPSADEPRHISKRLEKRQLKEREKERIAQEKLAKRQAEAQAKTFVLTTEERSKILDAGGVNRLVVAQRECLATLAMRITELPEEHIGLLAQVKQICTDAEPRVRMLGLATMAALFRDLIPGYRVLLQDIDPKELSKDVRKLHMYESTLLKHYQQFLAQCEAEISAARRLQRRFARRAGNEPEGDASAGGAPLTARDVEDMKQLSIVAFRCMAELLVAKPHFNFRNNLVIAIVNRLGTAHPPEIGIEAERSLLEVLKTDELGDVALDVTRAVTKLVRARTGAAGGVPVPAVRLLMSLRLLKELKPEDLVEAAKPKTQSGPGGKKGKKAAPHVSRQQRKLKKLEKEIDRDLRESEATYRREERIRLQTDTLSMVIQIYFRLIKQAAASGSSVAGPVGRVLPTVLEGLSAYAHLINIDFFQDLLVALRSVALASLPAATSTVAGTGVSANSTISPRNALHCVLAAFRLVSNHGLEALNLDLKDFYSVLFRLLPLLPFTAGGLSYTGESTQDDSVLLAVEAIDAMLHKAKNVSQERIAAFIKRLFHVASQMPSSNKSLLLVASAHSLLRRWPRTRALLDTEQSNAASAGVYRADADDPDLSAPFSSPLWDLAIMQQNFHPTVATLASRIAGDLPGLSGSPAELLAKYDATGGRTVFPAWTPPANHPLARAQEKSAGKALFVRSAAGPPSTFLRGIQSSHADRLDFFDTAEALPKSVTGAMSRHFIATISQLMGGEEDDDDDDDEEEGSSSGEEEEEQDSDVGPDSEDDDASAGEESEYSDSDSEEHFRAEC
ncbi:hypothetical protein H696_02962 [Fonticula alba]|uniref:Nucleolar complex-associated protein 3 N-terminal domain-containing protein n=1 Tax=Fonticula alba TaxID=691883 RepID=A0A058Z8I3_FONAL|nr:hypothetical protein H696_02962 [Fonticula alba]KCV70604.1 hypothetical protein H696_02962 [Fonticula alba]|eukprot:XP_009495120.1 hypothetical protein H696_02962 [Fonticula alba]